MQPSKDYFHEKSKTYEKEVTRTNNVKNIGEAILERLIYDKTTTHVMDFGSGTGLLTEQIAPFVRKMTTIDISPSMNEALRAKKEQLPCELEMLEIDLVNTEVDATFDGIISSMTIHHVEDVQALFHTFYRLLNSGGTIALADLDKEDGTFHTEDMGVFHFGFDQEEFATWAQKAGFEDVTIEIVSVAKKPYGDYPIFLLTGRKR
ncbi:methyltransferase domain-containing protein [Sulfurospirillum diekertiae]|uniref:Methyltransferase domain-containing protein n=1 Tax=Sulfurospirillum diekertiae TaxID=1854492 RepID=A0A6G9VR98_9BACT|nr:class I SAM-dependent methyltransferase [Sulfurospirillum diekertiae]QIR76057.1 methyltransferase domain-containing protein [Sulfurospirillum diekertiae]QIR78695.1 methyltransferase domain-containing protein [Sulfurospirillum diekertiae]